jgi:hypothetical protein
MKSSVNAGIDEAKVKADVRALISSNQTGGRRFRTTCAGSASDVVSLRPHQNREGYAMHPPTLTTAGITQAVVSIIVPTGPDVAFGFSISPTLLPSLSPSLSLPPTFADCALVWTGGMYAAFVELPIAEVIFFSDEN